MLPLSSQFQPYQNSCNKENITNSHDGLHIEKLGQNYITWPNHSLFFVLMIEIFVSLIILIVWVIRLVKKGNHLLKEEKFLCIGNANNVQESNTGFVQKNGHP